MNFYLQFINIKSFKNNLFFILRIKQFFKNQETKKNKKKIYLLLFASICFYKKKSKIMIFF